MQDRSTQFARANNLGGMGIYGDPERWGATESITLSANFADYTRQMVRAQCADLYATGWDLLMTWEQTGGSTLDPDTDLITCGTELTIGVGSSTTVINWIPIKANARAAAYTDQGITGGNTFDPANPYKGAALVTVPANAIAGRIGVGLQSPNQITVTFAVSLMLAPRVGIR